jgi:hypothetical protein
MATGHYFRSPAKWTLDRDEAYDFQRVSKAVQTAHKLRMRELELELAFEDLEETPATPFQTFLGGLSRPRRHSTAGRHASRSVALA